MNISFRILSAAVMMITAAMCSGSETVQEFVSYEKFGAKGDGKTDDQLAIAAAHDFANAARLPVKVKNNAKYYIGGGDRVITIMTDTDFGNAQFTIDDTKVKTISQPIFAVKTRKKSYKLKNLTSLYKNQKKLPVLLKSDSLLVLTDKNIKHFIRYGANANNGKEQIDIIIVSKDGTISKDTPLAWDFEKISSCTVYPIDEEQLVIKGGIFTTIANQEPGAHKYFARNIKISRSNVLVSNITHKVIEPDKPHSFPYAGFISISDSCNITVQDCVFSGRRVHKTVKPNSKSITTGTYDISLGRSANIRFVNCTQANNMLDPALWGVMGSNYCKNLEYDRCKLSRFDAHCGVYNATIKNSMIGRGGISVTGYGTLRVENTTVYARNFITLRPDYGSFWRGNIEIRNSTFIPAAGGKIAAAAIIYGNYSDHHNFGYACSMPTNVLVENLTVRDGNHTPKYKGLSVFSVFNEKTANDRKYTEVYPTAKPQLVTVRGIKTASGKYTSLSPNKNMFKGVKFVDEDRKQRVKENARTQAEKKNSNRTGKR